MTHIFIEGNLEVKLPTIWTDGKAEVGRVKKEKSRREKIREEKESEERRCMCAKGRKVTKHCVFPMICGSGGLKSRLAKVAGAEPSGQMRDEKLHAVVARSTFASEKAERSCAASTKTLKTCGWDSLAAPAALQRSRAFATKKSWPASCSC